MDIFQPKAARIAHRIDSSNIRHAVLQQSAPLGVLFFHRRAATGTFAIAVQQNAPDQKPTGYRQLWRFNLRHRRLGHVTHHHP